MQDNITGRQIEILGAAGKILSRSGVRGLTTKKIAKEMHFSEAALYRHFKGKEEIIKGLLHYIANEMDRRYLLLDLAGKKAEEQLIELFNEQFSFFKENPHFAVAVFSDGLLAENQSINSAIHRIMEVKKQHLLPLLKAARKEGSFTCDISAEHMMHIVMGAVRLEMFKWRAAQFEYDIKRKGNNVIKAILTLIKTSKA